MILEGLEEEGVMLFNQTLSMADVGDFHAPSIDEFHHGFDVEFSCATSLHFSHSILPQRSREAVDGRECRENTLQPVHLCLSNNF